MSKLLVLLSVLCAPVVLAQTREPFTLGTLTARAGERVHGTLDVPAGLDEGAVIPFTLIHGAQPGPVMLFIAGVHGSEYAPIVALQRLLPQLDPAKVRGTIILVHCANLPSFFKRTIYYSPVDGKNLNRSFPGKADGSLTERLAHVITTKLIPRADYVLDVHCGDGNEALVPYLAMYTHATTSERLDHVKTLARYFGIPHIKIISGRSADTSNSIYLTNAAQLAGKYVIAVECGGLARADDVSVNTIVNGLLNVLRHLRVLAGSAKPIRQPIYLERDETVRASASGIFYPRVTLGQRVQAGDLLGFVTDLWGRKVAEAHAPFAGKIMYLVSTPPVSSGEPLASLSQFKKQ